MTENKTLEGLVEFLIDNKNKLLRNNDIAEGLLIQGQCEIDSIQLIEDILIKYESESESIDVEIGKIGVLITILKDYNEINYKLINKVVYTLISIMESNKNKYVFPEQLNEIIDLIASSQDILTQQHKMALFSTLYKSNTFSKTFYEGGNNGIINLNYLIKFYELMPNSTEKTLLKNQLTTMKNNSLISVSEFNQILGE